LEQDIYIFCICVLIYLLAGLGSMKKEWITEDTNVNEKSLVRRLLYTRGIKTEEEIKEFLNPLEMSLTSPDVFTDMEKVTERLSKAIESNEAIVIYGDFDADGVTSTSILYKTLKHLNANVHYYIPDRENEGHGFDNKALIKLMTTIKPHVIISVDCGISDVNAVKFINSFKIIDVIITDHHEAPEILPEAFAIINPKAPGALSENLSIKQIEYLTYLAGCGVAFKVAQALLSKYGETGFIPEILPFVAVGTVADVVPLLGENRYFVAKGLELISSGKHEGLRQLLESAGYDITKGVTSENIAFCIAPRINASGRLDTVEAAVKVLISDNPQEVSMAVATLNEFNKIRQTLCQDIFLQADEMVKKEGNRNPAIVLYNENWHIGIIGIVASKLVEKYYKPVFLMTYVKEKDQFRCSARSIEGVPLYDVIAANAELFDNFGGHKLAAGLGFTGSKTPFEVVKKALNDTVKEYTSVNEPKPYVSIDLIVKPDDVTTELVGEISKLEPFGASNRSPVFEMDNLKVLQKKLMGSDNAHSRLTLSAGAGEFTAIWWKHGDIPLKSGDNLDIAFHPQINEFNGNVSVQLIVDDIHSDAIIEETVPACAYKINDCRTKTGILPNVNDYIKTTSRKVKVFAESKPVKDSLKSFSAICDNIFNRLDVPQCDDLIFFDYPADRETLDLILEKSNAKRLHFMYYEPKILDDQELWITFSKMLKFAGHNSNGRFDLIRSASFLGKSVKVIELMLGIFEEAGFIKINENNSGFYMIEFLGVDDIGKITQCQIYPNVCTMIAECEDFQNSLLEDNLERII